MRRVRSAVRLLGGICAGLVFCPGALAQAHITAPFDLQGPRIDMRVTRAGKTLPIAETPNLQPGDRVWVHADLPENQSAHYLMVIAFLRGVTNPPPEKWFLKAETWTKPVSEEGLVFTVPEGAQQTLLFLAPETGGDFKTLKNAVKGRPGSFVRSSQDLNQASLDRSRVETYLKAVRQVSESDPAKLQATTTLLARSLNLKVNQDCFERPVAEQQQCLTQESDAMVLNDGHSQSMVSALTNGPGSDLVTQLSYTPTAGAGYYSSYVGAIVDVVRLFDNFHTAAYQYIPALNFPDKDALDLKLNNPPSFHNPKSVIVVALPATQTAVQPPMRPLDPKAIYCMDGAKEMVLPASGAPLVFSTSYAHGLRLRVTEGDRKTLELPAHADAAKGGFVVDTQGVSLSSLPAHATGVIDGQWGFGPLEGPTFALASPHAIQWNAPAADAMALVVGREDDLHLKGNAAACVDNVTVRDAAGKERKAEFKIASGDELDVKVPLTDAAPGALRLLVEQHGLPKPDEVDLHSYAEAAHLDHFAIHAGDADGVLTGTRLDEVAGLQWNGMQFAPGQLSRAGDKDTLELKAAGDAKVPERAKGVAKVSLKDGRTMELATEAEAPRPRVALLSKNVEPAATDDSSAAIHLEDASELPLGGKVSFVLKAIEPDAFSRTERVEIASADNTLHTTLTLTDGSLVLQDAATLLGTFDPLKSFGPSAFGPLQMRAVDGAGAKGDWLPLGTLVRLPVLTGLHCARPARTAIAGNTAASPSAPTGNAVPSADTPGSASAASAAASAPASSTAAPDPTSQCTLSGSNLFLLDAVSTDAQFTHSVPVPDGFLGTTLTVPRPSGGPLYIRLRDDPAIANTVVVPPAQARADVPLDIRRIGQ